MAGQPHDLTVVAAQKKHDFRYLNAFETGSKMCVGIGKGLRDYNLARPHLTHGVLSPHEAYANNTKTMKSSLNDPMIQLKTAENWSTFQDHLCRRGTDIFHRCTPNGQKEDRTLNRSPHEIRASFAAAMSAMYKEEVPAYGTLVEIVEDVNERLLAQGSDTLALTPGEDTARISAERHGAIRLGTPQELAMMARVFAVMGMEPVGYYDLSVASVPVHSTAFRPTDRDALAANPFRVFTSLLRLELIEDETLRAKATEVLAARQIFTDDAIKLTEKAEAQGGLDGQDAKQFVAAVLETFRWHPEACVDAETFDDLIKAHRLIADVVSFKGPHINHLTPRTLDIDAAQDGMVAKGLPAKAVVEGPPRRRCPILLRQTAFKALNETIRFPSAGGGQDGQHTARFGEIEHRGAALTPKGRALYDQLLAEVRADILPAASGENADAYVAKLEAVFSAFPDDWRTLHRDGLAYFKYGLGAAPANSTEIETLLDAGALTLSPIIYEDFLPVSAAGIFQSNLGDEARSKDQTASSRDSFEAALGKPVIDEFALYEAMQKASLDTCLRQLQADAD